MRVSCGLEEIRKHGTTEEACGTCEKQDVFGGGHMGVGDSV